MASIADLCWTTAEDLMRDLDLDSLYVRQLRVLDGNANPAYPYLILVFTGKITIGINLGNGYGGPGGRGRACLDKTRANEDSTPAGNSFKDPLK
ncbi:MAG: hypothetical protein V1792_14715 [Pseudomonadota bacterium]